MHEQPIGLNNAALAGLAGAVALTTVHQVALAVTDEAPRMDIVGIRAIASSLRATGANPGTPDRLYPVALAGDIACNSAYYALVATGRRPNVWMRGVLLGLAAGIGALVLPRRLGLGDPPRSHRVANQIMTVAWYLIGGLAAAATAECLRETEPHLAM
jgi:hypothetical protein